MVFQFSNRKELDLGGRVPIPKSMLVILRQEDEQHVSRCTSDEDDEFILIRCRWAVQLLHKVERRWHTMSSAAASVRFVTHLLEDKYYFSKQFEIRYCRLHSGADVVFRCLLAT